MTRNAVSQPEKGEDGSASVSYPDWAKRRVWQSTAVPPDHPALRVLPPGRRSSRSGAAVHEGGQPGRYSGRAVRRGAGDAPPRFPRGPGTGMPARSRRATTLCPVCLTSKQRGGVGEGAHQLELMVGEAETIDVVGRPRALIGKENLRRRLFDDRRGDAALQGVPGALGREADHAVALSDGFLPVPDGRTPDRPAPSSPRRRR